MRQIIFLILLLVSIPSFAATYYVDFVDGADSNNGTAVETPFKHSPGDTTCDNPSTARSVVLAGGDTVIFKGGVVYSNLITINRNGSADSYITYDGNSAGTWGTGKAIIDGGNTRYYGFKGSNNSWIKINNFELRNFLQNSGGSSDESGGIHFEGTVANTSLYISNNYVHDSGHHDADCSGCPCGTATIAGIGIHIIHGHGCTVTGNEVTNAGAAGIRVTNAVNTMISSNTIHVGVKWGIVVTGDGGGATGNTIRGNTIYDLYAFDEGFYPQAPVDGACNPHTDFIFMHRGSGTRPSGNVVENNILYNNYTFTDNGGTAQIFLSEADSTIVRNNIAINPHSYYAFDIGQTSTGTELYGNIVYSPRDSSIIFNTTGAAGTTILKNNVILGKVQMTNATTTATLAADYNVYLTANPLYIEIGPPRIESSFAAWQALGQDANSPAPLANQAAFGFTDISGYPATSNTMDLTSAAGSPIINAGAVVANNLLDRLDAVRGANPDAGAYEYGGSSGGDVTAPEITVVAATGTLTGAVITWTTDEVSGSQVDYGPTAAYGSSVAAPSLLLTSHSMTISGLSSSTLYHYRVLSRDAAGNLATGSDQTFGTAAISRFRLRR